MHSITKLLIFRPIQPARDRRADQKIGVWAHRGRDFGKKWLSLFIRKGFHRLWFQVCCPPDLPKQNLTLTPLLHAFSVYGLQNGLIFSSVNGISADQSQPNRIIGSFYFPSSAPNTPGPANNNQNYQPEQAFTFAPLNAKRTTTTIQPIKTTKIAQTWTNDYVVTRPENQCGLSNVTHSRIVGGDIAQLGIQLSTSTLEMNSI